MAFLRGLGAMAERRNVPLSTGLDMSRYRLFIGFMKTLTATEARKNLTRWLKAAKGGQDIGIVYGADIFALRPVPVQATDYTQREYGATPPQLDTFTRRNDAELDRERKSGRMATFTGKLPKRRAG